MKIKTKYNLGDIVWFMNMNRPGSFKVTYIFVTITDGGRYSVDYSVNHMSTKYAEDTLFSTKKELLSTL